MSERIRKPKRTEDKEVEQEEAEPKDQQLSEEQQAELDDLMESIDEALGENAVMAQEFVASYLQKGGQALLPVLAFTSMAGWAAQLLA